MADCLMVDPDVLIDYLRGRAEAVAYLDSLSEPLCLSAITVAELYAGVREGEERAALDLFLQAFEIVDVDQQAAIQGGLFRRDYAKSHNAGLADALIAATAIRREATLVTLNDKHFSMLAGVVVPYEK